MSSPFRSGLGIDIVFPGLFDRVADLSLRERSQGPDVINPALVEACRNCMFDPLVSAAPKSSQRQPLDSNLLISPSRLDF